MRSTASRATPTTGCSTDVLRGEWGYQGAVVSDYYGIRELVTRHHLYDNVTDAAERAIKSGVDVETPDPEGYVASARAGARGTRADGADRPGGAAGARAEVRSRAVRKPLSRPRDGAGEDRNAGRDRPRPRSGGQGHRPAEERPRPAAARTRQGSTALPCSARMRRTRRSAATATCRATSSACSKGMQDAGRGQVRGRLQRRRPPDARPAAGRATRSSSSPPP